MSFEASEPPSDIELLRTLGAKYSAEILAASHEARSAQELSERLDIPIATTYRRIEALAEAGLLDHEDSILTEERKRVDVYRREVDAVRVRFEQGTVSTTTTGRPEIKDKLDEAWRSGFEETG